MTKSVHIKKLVNEMVELVGNPSHIKRAHKAKQHQMASAVFLFVINKSN